MKKLSFLSFSLSAITQLVTGATGYRSGEEYIVLLAPILIITILWGGYAVKKKLKERKERELNAANEHDTASDTPAM
jgi:hypothetical protein